VRWRQGGKERVESTELLVAGLREQKEDDGSDQKPKFVPSFTNKRSSHAKAKEQRKQKSAHRCSQAVSPV
jgi:hypothetical protein